MGVGRLMAVRHAPEMQRNAARSEHEWQRPRRGEQEEVVGAGSHNYIGHNYIGRRRLLGLEAITT